ncbi:DUF3265 domain-containing protein [Vibrio sp. S9_S30]|nr:DUF3265 domain-containing protein [Vibrio sp. S9_S30]
MIRNAWHFHYVLVLVIKVVYGSFGIALLTPWQGVISYKKIGFRGIHESSGNYRMCYVFVRSHYIS